jgi:hypothetical protein
MAHSKGISDKDIGRPESWREGRYQSESRAHSEIPRATQADSVTTWYRRKPLRDRK